MVRYDKKVNVVRHEGCRCQTGGSMLSGMVGQCCQTGRCCQVDRLMLSGGQVNVVRWAG